MSQKIVTPHALRRVIQCLFLFFCLFIGYRLFQHFLWAIGQSSEFVPKPPSVEAFLPISALMAAKRFILTNKWDMVHPAGLTLFFAFIWMALLFRKSFCGYICPVGFVSNLVEQLGRKLKLQKELPTKVEHILSVPKYLILGGFVYFIVIKMSTRQIESFLTLPYNYVADSKMLTFFLAPSGTTLLIIAVLAALSLFIRNFWCRFLCPYGALLGLCSTFSPTAITRNTEICVSCGKCRKICPSAIHVDERSVIHSPECIGCAECVGVCPVNKCLTVRTFNKKVPFVTIAIGCLGTLMVFYSTAVLTGHWYSETTPELIRKFHMLIFNK
ncbi:4Fe-4S binding protein [Halodesulfovibrio marinisediminis]|uniref:4Fe-4S binding domain-containing protein n=1 Tax=Halodesulfovibrio marinisediminis DSM 17456 TaxID=1121457 RepID=A0A1N6HJR4_9BACT|nr:4Fe-4S binding protein [Halodesulfovibrio marinisediminis]SIO19976.1 4Fe-4S binding domain-containing protein [Halodesulfovibrio marinisediminis DSM 17456]